MANTKTATAELSAVFILKHKSMLSELCDLLHEAVNERSNEIDGAFIADVVWSLEKMKVLTLAELGSMCGLDSHMMRSIGSNSTTFPRHEAGHHLLLSMIATVRRQVEQNFVALKTQNTK